MFKQKVSRILAAFMTLALVVSVMPQGGLNRLIPSAQANLMSPASHSPDSCSDGQNKSKSGSINGSLEPTNTFKVTLSGGVGEVVSIFLPGKGTTNFPADTTVATVSDVSSSGSWVVTYKCEGTGSGSALVNFDSASYNLTSSWTWTTSVATAPTLEELSVTSISHNHTPPHDVPVTVKCKLNGGSFVSMSVASSADIVGAPGSVSGSGSIERTLSFSIRNALAAPYTATSIDVSCTNSVGLTTRTDYVFNYTNATPVITNPQISVAHTTSNGILATVNFTDADAADTVSGFVASNADLTAQTPTPGNPASLDLTFDFNNNLVKTVSISGITDTHVTNPGSVTVTIADQAFTINLDTSVVEAFYGVGSLSELTQAIITANPGSSNLGIGFADGDGDNAQNISCGSVSYSGTGASINTTAAPFSAPGTVSGGPYTTALSLNAGTFTGGFLTGICTMFGTVNVNFELQLGSVGGGSRLRGDLGTPVIEKQGGTDYSTGLSLDYKTSFGSDLKLSASYDYPTQVRACWKVAIGADGKQIGERVSTSATAGATESGPSMGSPGFGLSLGYDLDGFGLGLGAGYTSDDDFTDESSKYLNGFGFTDWKLGFGLSLGGLYGSGDDVDVDDDDTEFTIPLGSDWKIGAGFDYGLGLNPGPSVGYNSGDKEVDGYPANSPTGSFSQGGAYGGTYNF